MCELEELIAEIKATRRFDALEMEFIHTRTKGILQLMQLFDSKDETVQNEYAEELKIVEREQEKPVSAESFEEPAEEKQPDEKEIVNEPEIAEPRQEDIREKEPAPKPVMEDSPGTTVQEESGTSKPLTTRDKEDDDMLEEEAEKTEATSRLGDSFLKGKSVNDLITDQNKLEFKLSNRPVSSIQAAIGINDRFQYIRELFDGDNQKFLEAVKALDSKQNIKEAVDYLRTNYKWKKNETSLKFVNLVKRRFLNV